MPDSEKLKSLLYVLTGILFVLVLLDKSTGSGFRSSGSKEGNSGFFSRFNTLGKNNPLPPASPGEKESHEEVMDKAEDEILSELMQNGTASVGRDWSESESNDSDDIYIPVVDPARTSGTESTEHSLRQDPGEVELYFLKFFGKGNKSHSRLVRVKRNYSSGDKLHFILRELSKGPAPEEKTKGVLNALPQKFTYSSEYSVENGILKLSLGSEFESGAGPELLKDRVDQLCYSLLENLNIKGIKLYINGKKVHSLGGVGLPIPEVLTKNPRKIAVL
ncbi:spore gernimation protein [Leptospira fletcheri]|uniref:Spore gernimation protein n=1 Tax=Leptospira fletcheri TaxID=2484981 RepID=A0A4R9GIV6_9LEPT|nr:GerMN domain-containing protein [Leptospira fletcheri]TGK13049.1 spore gernimation protein [Leptospira fletcheri]